MPLEETENETRLPAVAARTAREVCERLELQDAALALLEADLTPAGFLDRLLERELFADATKFLAHALPKSEAIWWGVLCVRGALADELEPAGLHALAAAEAWLREPSDALRRAALAAGEAAGYGTAAGWVAAGAGWSGGSLAPADAETQVPPDPQLSATAVTAALLLAAARSGRSKTVAMQRRFLALGLDVATGQSRWA